MRDQPLDQGQADAQVRLGSARRELSTWANISNTTRQRLGARPMPVSRTADHDLVGFHVGRERQILPPGGRVFGPVVQQIRKYLGQPGHVGIEIDRPLGQ